MARKAIIEGGKREEILKAATGLFFTYGYEDTTVRDVLKVVGGEVGMFYHYFKSKQELFDAVVNKFFIDYKKKFHELSRAAKSPEQFIRSFLELYSSSMRDYRMVENQMHWTIKYALSARTIEELKPELINLLAGFNYSGAAPLDVAAGQLLYGISATIHSESFPILSHQEQYRLIHDFYEKVTHDLTTVLTVQPQNL